MNLRWVRLLLLVLVAVPSAVSAVIVGPLSFVGLMVPHLAAVLGARRVPNHLMLIAMLGGGIMVLADWAGRTLAFPYEVPAGLLASLVGGPYFLWSMRKR